MNHAILRTFMHSWYDVRRGGSARDHGVVDFAQSKVGELLISAGTAGGGSGSGSETDVDARGGGGGGGGGERHGSMWLKDVESANKNHVNEYREVMTAWLLKKYQSLYNAFIALDRNKNGVIGPVEFKAAVEEILAESEVTSFFPPKFGEFSGSAPCLHHGKARFGGGFSIMQKLTFGEGSSGWRWG